MLGRAAWLQLASTAALLLACAEDPELERRGGSEVPSPMSDPPLGSAGGGAEGGAGSGVDEPVEFCQALAVVRAKCHRCHIDPPQNSAPAPLVTYEDFQKIYFEQKRWWERAREVVETDYMPYLDFNAPPLSLMPPIEPLTPEEKATLMGWFDEGALPLGGTDCP